MSWYLSYASKQKGFAGAAIVEASGIEAAIDIATSLGIGPPAGCEVLGTDMTGHEEESPEKYRNRFLSRADVYEMWPDTLTLGEADAEGLQLDPQTTALICANCVAGKCVVH